MTEQQFWHILDLARRGRGGENPDFHCEEWTEALGAELARLQPDEILRFRGHLDDLGWAADTDGMVAANDLINAGSETDFYYLRCWLVGMGEAVYKAALADADSLADVLEGQWPVGIPLANVAADMWEEKTGQTDIEAALRQLPESAPPGRGEDLSGGFLASNGCTSAAMTIDRPFVFSTSAWGNLTWNPAATSSCRTP